MRFVKAHAYGNDFLYVRTADLGPLSRRIVAIELCDRHSGVGADGLIVFEPTSDGASMQLFNPDGGRAEISGNGVRALAAILLDREGRVDISVVIQTDAGPKRLTRLERSGSRQTFRAAMGPPQHVRQVPIVTGGEAIQAVVMHFGNPQCVVLGPLPADDRFRRLGPAIERHEMFPDGTNVEFAEVQQPECVRILIWERGVGPTASSGTGSCAALVAASTFGGAARHADIVAPGGTQRVEWRDDGIELTGWAEVLFEGEWRADRRA